MSIICLSEIEENILIHSNLKVQSSFVGDCYCVLIKYWLIVFKKSTDLVSWKRLPINKSIKLTYEAKSNQFSIILGNFQYIFISSDVSLIENWVKEINVLLLSYENLKSNYFKYAEVKIFSNETPIVGSYILIYSDEYLVHIYQDLVEHGQNICTHTINLKFYSFENSVSNISQRRKSVTNKCLRLFGKTITFKIKFDNSDLAKEWNKTFIDAINMAFVGSESENLKQIYSNESNKFCADCHYPNPDWVSINLCVILCFKCSELHRTFASSHSHILSAIDQRFCEDSVLIEIIKKIGNEKSNSFWYKNKKKSKIFITDLSIVKDKYIEKLFINNEFINLSENEIKTRLRCSVISDDVFLTMKLYHSIKFPYDSEFIKELLLIARNSNQYLQEKFLSVQPDLSYFNQNQTSFDEKIFKISYNNEEKLIDLFSVSLLCNCFSINVDELVTPFISTNVCCVYYTDIELIYYDSTDECLIITLTAKYQFYKKTKNKTLANQPISVHRLSFFEKSNVIKEFQLYLFKLLMPNHFVDLTFNSNLFMNLEVKINENNIMKCKFHVDEKEIIFYSIGSIFNLKNTEIQLKKDKNTIYIYFNNYQIKMVTVNSDSQHFLTNYLNLFTHQKPIMLNPVDKMITFIITRGLKSEFIFREAGMVKKVDTLLELIEKSPNEFLIDPNVYTVHDVVSCLKKYLQSFSEPIITDHLFDLFCDACKLENTNLKLTQLKFIISCMPNINYQIFRKIIELLYMVQMFTEENKMDSKSLGITTALSFISFDENKKEMSHVIMKELIDYFETVFNYSPQESETLRKFIENPLQREQTIIRDFYIHPFLKDILLIKTNENLKLGFIENGISFSMIHLPVNQCVTVKDICLRLFRIFDFDLLNFQTKRNLLGNKTLKRFINLNENIHNSIVCPKSISDFYENYFVFLPKQHIPDTIIKSLFKCEFKLKLENYQEFILIIKYPNSLEFFSQNPTVESHFEISWTDIKIFRYHLRNIKKIIILSDNNDIYRCKFFTGETLQELLCFFDQFK